MRFERIVLLHYWLLYPHALAPGAKPGKSHQITVNWKVGDRVFEPPRICGACAVNGRNAAHFRCNSGTDISKPSCTSFIPSRDVRLRPYN